MIKAVIFDNNGVMTSCDDEASIPKLAEYFDVEVEYLRSIYHKVVEPANRGEITTEEFFCKLTAAIDKNCVLEEIWPIFMTCYKPKPEMKPFLLELGKKYKIVLLTNFIDCFEKLNKAVWHYEDIFREAEMFVSSKIHLVKPNENIYLYALSHLGLKAEETIFVDDRETNIEAANKLGMRTVHFTSPAQCKNELEYILSEGI